jgi:hypothetical protein
MDRVAFCLVVQIETKSLAVQTGASAYSGNHGAVNKWSYFKIHGHEVTKTISAGATVLKLGQNRSANCEYFVTTRFEATFA